MPGKLRVCERIGSRLGLQSPWHMLQKYGFHPKWKTRASAKLAVIDRLASQPDPVPLLRLSNCQHHVLSGRITWLCKCLPPSRL
jgi:hypothetical protein